MSTTVFQNLFPCYDPKPAGKQGPECRNMGFCNDDVFHVKSSFSGLTARSLQLCTENLGSETGTEMSSPPPYSPSSSGQIWRKRRPRPPTRKTMTFPPPLMTMSGASTLQVRRRTENGRLIMEAELRNAKLQAERSDGRLKLSFPADDDIAKEKEEEVSDVGSDAEIGTGEFQRPRRCKEGGQGTKQQIEQSLWVVTSKFSSV